MDRKHKLGKLGKAFITIVVGEGDEQEEFTIHEALATQRSRFFRNCMKGNWKEAEDRVVKLPKEEPAIFELYVQSLYAGHVSNQDDTSPPFPKLGKIFALAHMLQDTEARNTATKEIFAKIERVVVPSYAIPPADFFDMITSVWETSDKDAPIRRLLVDTFKSYNMLASYGKAEKEQIIACFEKVPADFHARVTWEFMARYRKTQWLGEDLNDVSQYLEKVESEK
ncbi:hypothetical protein BDV96DRAFT_640181 [Lophiotrema nucula]|uniref:BTB domain-containing protein n=1 Tax=Lophiotrema nucula TaxID=690887 RepID=A0A6A5ZS90_9PLEO|nr:hypothetical protein BDV96DRAFT_640181 [Lophiotrema nucula]